MLVWEAEADLEMSSSITLFFRQGPSFSEGLALSILAPGIWQSCLQHWSHRQKPPQLASTWVPGYLGSELWSSGCKHITHGSISPAQLFLLKIFLQILPSSCHKFESRAILTPHLTSTAQQPTRRSLNCVSKRPCSHH